MAHDECKERVIQAAFTEHELTLDLKKSRVPKLGPNSEYPYLKPLDFAECLVRNGRERDLVGFPTLEQAGDTLADYWQKFRVLFPGHRISELLEKGLLNPRRLIPLYLHGDEGRTYRKNGIMILCMQGALGHGSLSGRRANQVKKQQLKKKNAKMNLYGHTFCTRQLFSVAHKKAYDKTPEVLHQLLDVWAKELKELLLKGFASKAGNRFRCAVVGCKGDWPFLVKAGRLNRSFYNTPKRAVSKTACTGVCHKCLAGRPQFPFEDVAFNATFWGTLAAEKPWDEPGSLLSLPHDEESPEEFYKPDVWHNYYLGSGKCFLGGGMVIIVQILAPPGSVDKKFQFLSLDYRTFCEREKLTPIITGFTKETFGWLQTSDVPIGGWSKGALTTTVGRWMLDFLDRHMDRLQENVMLPILVSYIGL